MKLIQSMLRSKSWKDQRGQDMIEYSLIAGFITVAGGAAIPNVAGQFYTIYSRLYSVVTSVANL